MSELPDAPDECGLAGESSSRLAVLFDAHADRLYRLARRLVPSPDDALDLVQETFLRVARSLDSMPDGRREEEAWLIRVLVNLRRDQWRKELVRRKHRLDAVDMVEPRRDPEAALAIRSTVWSALDALPPRRRAVVVMHELEGLSIASIALLLGVATVTVRWHLSLGRRELARRLRSLLGDTHDPRNTSARRRPATPRSSTS